MATPGQTDDGLEWILCTAHRASQFSNSEGVLVGGVEEASGVAVEVKPTDDQQPVKKEQNRKRKYGMI
ncbi:hypothetical protein ACEPPN_003020 [Leptodophora sp. 'Broadleaf-Isolate-01']